MTNKNCDGIERAIFSGAAGEINNNNLLMTNKNCEGISKKIDISSCCSAKILLFFVFLLDI